MAVPKRRTPKARQRSRRGHHGVALPQLVACSNCRAKRLNHAPCPACGLYNGRQVLRRGEDGDE